MFIFWIACGRISIWKEMYLVSRKLDFHMVEDMHTLYSIILSGVQNTEKSGSYSFAGRLQAAVFHFRYDKNYEGESGKADVPCSSGIKTGTVGRSFVESILLCSDGQRSKQGAGTGLYRNPKGKRKQQKTEIQKRKRREMIVCRLHPVMA